MKLRELVPPDALAEMNEVAHELKQERADFDPIKDPMDRISVMMQWCIREIVRLRRQT